MCYTTSRGILMSDIVAYISLIISGLVLVALIVLIIIFVRKTKEASNNVNPLDQQGIGEVKAKIDNIDRQVEKTVEVVMSKEMVKLTKEFGNNTEKSSQNLSHFQSEVTEFLTKRIESLNKQLDEKIAQLDKKVDDKLKEGFKGTSESMAQVRERLQAIDDAQKQMENLGKDVVSLKNVLEGNQSRGRYGEYQLSMVLHNVFGDVTGCYEEQFTMKKVKDGNDVRADAVVFMPEPNKMIAIDSKFPFQDYKRIFDAENDEEKESLKRDFAAAVKKHITDIKDKYIVENKTAPEALMFIPNDGVFAFIHSDLQDVVDYARDKRVILTSPSTLPPILVTINMVRIDAERAKNAKEISKQLGKLGKDFEMFAREWETLSRQLETATKSREKLDSRVSKITGKFGSISAADLIDEKEEEKEIKEISILDEED